MFISNKPLIAEINDGAENISLNGKNDNNNTSKQKLSLGIIMPGEVKVLFKQITA